MSILMKNVLATVMLLALMSFAQSDGKQQERFVFHTFSIALSMDLGGTWTQYSNLEYEDSFTRDRDLNMDMTMGLQLKWTRDLVYQNGLSFEVGAGIGFINFPVNESKNYSYYDPYAHMNQIDSRFDLNAKVGLGYAPFANDFILAVHAILGVDMKYFGKSYQDFTEDISTWLFNFVGGADIVVGYRITERLGINAGVDVAVNLFGFGYRTKEYSYSNDNFETIDYKLNHVFSGFQIVPRVGVSLRF
ncbi:hypothetical protein [Fibrobacter sp.]|uniref:hypothetical protein n=1 Tax=Fibrobacter sp. TaxID=35828 RepID=UPI0038699442